VIEGWLQCRELFQRGVAARDRVAIDAVEGDDDVLEEALVLARDGALVTEQRALVLVGARDRETLGGVFGVNPAA
jgi:hypothetical protein